MIQPIGHFRIWRELYTKPIWLNSTVQQQVILMTLMAMANFRPNEWEWKGEKFRVKEGQLITSLESIRINTGGTVSIQNIRTALKRFEKLEFLTNQSTKSGRLITLVNWRDYQYTEGDTNKGVNKDLTKSQQRPNKDLTPKEEGKKVRKKEDKDTDVVINAFKEKLSELPQPRKITDKRKQHIKARIKEYNLETVLLVIDKISKSDFLLGNVKEFKADIDWIFNVNNFAKILEGKYDNRKADKSKVIGLMDYQSPLGEREEEW